MIEGGPATISKLRVLHFVSGGFSGATQVAVDLCRMAPYSERVDAVLVLRRRRITTPERVQALRDQGLHVRLVPGWSRLAMILSLWWLCRRLRPAVFVAHGFAEHLWGRYAGLLAGVPHLVQVEHNSRERYTRWRLWQTRWLARRSARLVGVSDAVGQSLVARGLPADKVVVIPNGIELQAFADADAFLWSAREAAIVMSARFAPQKDHVTLVRALALLRARGLTPPLRLAGTGHHDSRREVEAEVMHLGLQGQVQFLGHHGAMPQLLMSHQVCVLSTHWEGMPLALIEGMAAGCACVASAVSGIEDVIETGVTGLLVAPQNAAALADALERVLRDPNLGASLGAAARGRALAQHGVRQMVQRYDALLLSL